jgi:hypothetical protein
LKITEVSKAFYNSNPELHNRGISWENFKARFLHRFRDVRSGQYHFMQLQRARQKKDETPQQFLDRCRSLAMKTDPKVEDRLLQKFHYDQAQQVLLSTFIAGLSGNPEQQVRFQLPVTTRSSTSDCNYSVSGRSTGEKKFDIFSNSETHKKKFEANLVRPGTPLEDQSMDRLLILAQIRCMQAGSSVSKTHAQLTLATKGNCSALSV